MKTPSSGIGGSRIAPGPKGLPFVGNLLDVYGNPLALFMKVSASHGNVVRMKFGPYLYFMMNDVEAIKHVLVDNVRNFTKSRNYDGLKLVLGEGLVTSEGDFWRRQRRLAQPAFHRERLAGFAQAMADDTQAMLDQWRTSMTPGTPFDLHHEMMALTLRIVCRTLFSTVVGAEAEKIGKAIDIVLPYANDYAEAVIKPPQWLPTPARLRFARSVRTIDDLVYRIINDRRNKVPGRDEPNDLLSMLMAATDDVTKTGMTDQQLRDEVMTLVMAGHETTANAMTWTFYLLSKDPEVERRLHAEVSRVLGDRMPTMDDLPKLKYTSMVIQESMRLFPPVWAFERQAVEDDVVAGYAIPAKAIIAISPYALHRSPTFWENPEGFDPDRFAPELAESRPKYAYLPFGAGARQCIGNGFAMMEAQIILAMIVQRHRLAIVPGKPIETDPVITLRPKHGMPMTLLPQVTKVGTERNASRRHEGAKGIGSESSS